MSAEAAASGGLAIPLQITEIEGTLRSGLSD